MITKRARNEAVEELAERIYVSMASSITEASLLNARFSFRLAERFFEARDLHRKQSEAVSEEEYA